MTTTTLPGRSAPASFTLTHMPVHVGAILAALSARFLWHVQTSAERRAIRHLRELDAHLLRDIGLEPSGIEEIRLSTYTLARS